jgi:MSHA biogenesis protein MshJ
MTPIQKLLRHKSLEKSTAYLNGLVFRERVLLTVTGLIAIWFVWNQMFLEGQTQQRKTLQSGLKTVETQMLAENARQQQLQQALQMDPNQQEKIRLERYTQEIGKMDEALKAKTLEFITPQQMVEVMKKLIGQEPGLQLVRLESTGPDKPLQEQAAEAAEAGQAAAEKPETEAKAKGNEPNVYVHGLEMTFSGDFFSTLNYVKRLESLEWRFSWALVSLTLDEYPKTEIKIRLETLSLTEGWIGV